MRSPPSSLDPPSPPPHRRLPDWAPAVVWPVALLVGGTLFVVVGWPLLVLLGVGAVFAAGVWVGYTGAKSEDFRNHVERWLD